MICEVKLKTGFFKTTLYNMIIADNHITLASSTAHKKNITIKDINLLVITSTEMKSAQIEIQTHDSIYTGILNENVNLDELLTTMRNQLNVKKGIICNTHA